MNQIIAIDIGNTTTSAALVDTGALTCSQRRDIPTAELKQRLPDAIRSLRSSLDPAIRPQVIASSVVKPARSELPSVLASCGLGEPEWVRWHASLSVTVGYPDPMTLGTDRLANALYCTKAFPGRNVIIIDAGTAIKVDLVENGKHFAGGTIFPGISAQLEALHAATSQLPRLASGNGVPPLPGRSTTECIQAGVMYGIAGAVEKITGAYMGQTGKESIILATGGAWPHLAKLVELDVRHVPDLTLIGIGTFTV